MARRKKSAVLPQEAGRILERPDGFYWENEAGELRGPFVTRAEAEADRLAGGELAGDFEAGESLHEAESEIGMSEWIDPDTGGPAEDNIPRIEDH
jgi:hypothetical protein